MHNSCALVLCFLRLLDQALSELFNEIYTCVSHGQQWEPRLTSCEIQPLVLGALLNPSSPTPHQHAAPVTLAFRVCMLKPGSVSGGSVGRSVNVGYLQR